MKVYIFSYWYKPENKTSVNRTKYFKHMLEKNGISVEVVYVNQNQSKASGEKRSKKLSYYSNFFQNMAINSQKVNRKIVYRFFYVLYLFFSKSDLYDFLKILKIHETKGDFNFHKDDIIITSSPPYSVMDVGYYLHKKYGCKWIIDYRDPWTFGYTLLNWPKYFFWLYTRLVRSRELTYLQSADRIITVSTALKNMLPEKFHSKTVCIENGANSLEIKEKLIIDSPSVFSIVYSGTVYNAQLLDKTFFSACKQFIVANDIPHTDFKLYFIGSAENENLKNMLIKFNLYDYSIITERLPLKRAYEFMYQASLFLQLKYNGIEKIITSKQYDYLALQKKILLPSSDNGDIAKSILENNAGYVCISENELIEVIEKEYQRFLNKESFKINTTNVYKFSRLAHEATFLNTIHSLSKENK